MMDDGLTGELVLDGVRVPDENRDRRGRAGPRAGPHLDQLAADVPRRDVRRLGRVAARPGDRPRADAALGRAARSASCRPCSTCWPTWTPTCTPRAPPSLAGAGRARRASGRSRSRCTPTRSASISLIALVNDEAFFRVADRAVQVHGATGLRPRRAGGEALPGRPQPADPGGHGGDPAQRDRPRAAAVTAAGRGRLRDRPLPAGPRRPPAALPHGARRARAPDRRRHQPRPREPPAASRPAPHRHRDDANPFTYCERAELLRGGARPADPRARLVPFDLARPELWRALRPARRRAVRRAAAAPGRPRRPAAWPRPATGWSRRSRRPGDRRTATAIRAAMRAGGDWEGWCPPATVAPLRAMLARPARPRAACCEPGDDRLPGGARDPGRARRPARSPSSAAAPRRRPPRTPVLDELARRGASGWHVPLGWGRAPSSELAHWALFGYERRAVPRPRGAGGPRRRPRRPRGGRGAARRAPHVPRRRARWSGSPGRAGPGDADDAAAPARRARVHLDAARRLNWTTWDGRARRSCGSPATRAGTSPTRTRSSRTSTRGCGRWRRRPRGEPLAADLDARSCSRRATRLGRRPVNRARADARGAPARPAHDQVGGRRAGRSPRSPSWRASRAARSPAAASTGASPGCSDAAERHVPSRDDLAAEMAERVAAGGGADRRRRAVRPRPHQGHRRGRPHEAPRRQARRPGGDRRRARRPAPPGRPRRRGRHRRPRHPLHRRRDAHRRPDAVRHGRRRGAPRRGHRLRRGARPAPATWGCCARRTSCRCCSAPPGARRSSATGPGRGARSPCPTTPEPMGPPGRSGGDDLGDVAGAGHQAGGARVTAWTAETNSATTRADVVHCGSSPPWSPARRR